MGDTIEMAGPIQSGESYPTVTIGGMTMAIKWHMSASYEMSKRGFALAEVVEDGRGGRRPDPRRTSIDHVEQRIQRAHATSRSAPG